MKTEQYKQALTDIENKFQADYQEMMDTNRYSPTRRRLILNVKKYSIEELTFEAEKGFMADYEQATQQVKAGVSEATWKYVFTHKPWVNFGTGETSYAKIIKKLPVKMTLQDHIQAGILIKSLKRHPLSNRKVNVLKRKIQLLGCNLEDLMFYQVKNQAFIDADVYPLDIYYGD